MHRAQHAPPRDREGGFTLIELLVVIIIIGVLASIAIPTFLGQRRRANETAMKSDLRSLAAYAETFWSDNNTYVGFEASTLYTEFVPTTNVSIDVVGETVSTYCIEATHPDVTDNWYYDSAQSPALTQTSC